MGLLDDFATSLNVLSTVCALLVILVFVAIKIRDRDALDRVSIRLQLGIAVVDVIKHVMACFSPQVGTSLCTAFGFINVLLYQLYMALNISIALNLHLIILSNKKPRKGWERIYWGASLGLPTLLCVPALVTGAFGAGSTSFCYMVTGTWILDNLKMVYNTYFSFFTIAYCIAISALVVHRVKRGVSQALSREAKASRSKEENHALVSLKSLICRTCLYPASCFLAYVGSNISMTYYFFHKTNAPLLLFWQKAGYSSRGTLHLFAFLADPLVLTSIKGLFSQDAQEEDEYKTSISHLASESEYSFEYLTAPLPTDSSASLLRQRMVKDFKRYI